MICDTPLWEKCNIILTSIFPNGDVEEEFTLVYNGKKKLAKITVSNTVSLAGIANIDFLTNVIMCDNTTTICI